VTTLAMIALRPRAIRDAVSRRRWNRVAAGFDTSSAPADDRGGLSDAAPISHASAPPPGRQATAGGAASLPPDLPSAIAALEARALRP
jgi:hypothetical protein